MRFFLLCALLPASLLAQPASQPTSEPVGPLVRMCGDRTLLEGEFCEEDNLKKIDPTPAAQNAEAVFQEPAQKTKPQEAPAAPGLPLKDPQKARNLAASLTLVGLFIPGIGLPFLLIGPTTGHIYAKEYKRAGSLMLLHLATSATSIGGIVVILAGCERSPCGLYISTGTAMIIGGSLASNALAAFGIWDSSRAVLRYNAKLYDPSQPESVVPLEAAPWTERFLHSAEIGNPKRLSKPILTGALSLGGVGLAFASASVLETMRIRVLLDRSLEDGITLEESQALGDIEKYRKRANALGIVADTFFTLSIPLAGAGWSIKKKEDRLLSIAQPKSFEESQKEQP